MLQKAMASELIERSCEPQDIVILFAIMSKIQLLIIKVHSMNFKLAKDSPSICHDLEFVIGLDTRELSIGRSSILRLLTGELLHTDGMKQCQFYVKI